MIAASAVRMDDGKIYIGKRHHDCIKLAMATGYYTRVNQGQQGFITDADVFLTREEAAKIAYSLGQVPYKKKKLYSEDLW